MRLSQLSQKRIDEIVKLLDRCVGSHAAQVGITREELLDTLRHKGLFSRQVGSRLNKTSRLEFFVDRKSKDPVVEVDFIANFANLPEDDTIRQARDVVQKFREQIKSYMSRGPGPPTREGFTQRKDQRRSRRGSSSQRRSRRQRNPSSQ